MTKFRTVFLAMLLSLDCSMSHGASGDVDGREPNAATSPVKVPEHPPVVLEIERLFRLQDATARGVPASVAAQKEIILTVSDMLRDPPATPSEQLVYYTAAYVLSGGDPNTARRLSEVTGLKKKQRDLLSAAALFMMGDKERAGESFRQIRLESLPSALRGRVALALALIEKDTAEIHQKHLALAIASMPGTLVEESSLRRSALAYAEGQDERPFWARLDRYYRRFRTSIFAARFTEDMIDSLVVWFSKERPPSLRRTDLLLTSLPVPERQRSYLYLARRAALAGEIGLTEFAARRLRRISLENSPDDNIARLYTALFAIVTSEGDIAAQQLKLVRREHLSDADQALLNAALAVDTTITAPVEESSSSHAESETTPVEDRGTQLLNDTKTLLENVRL